MMCSRVTWSLVAVTLGVGLATARPSSASVGEDDVREEPGATGDAMPLEEPGEEPGEDSSGDPVLEEGGRRGESELGEPTPSAAEDLVAEAAEAEPESPALVPTEAPISQEPEEHGGVHTAGTDDTAGAWRPPPDPLLSDADVPAWPATISAGTSDTGDRGVAGVALDVVEARQVQEDELRRARGWTRAGIVGVVAGAALVSGAVAMRFSDPCAFGAGNNCFEEARNRAAATMGIPGGVFIAGGVAMIIAGQVQRSRLIVAPTMAGRGLVLTGRF